jgi:hypothetical protein
MISRDLNVLPLVWKSTSISTTLPFAYFQSILTMTKQTDDQQNFKPRKDDMECGTF